MRIGVISDLHANLPALETVLRGFRERGVDGIICCGDLIGIGPFPEETVRRVMSLPNLLGCVRGNHEEYLLSGIPAEGMDGEEVQLHRWAHSALSPESRSFLASLPRERTLETEGRRLALVHYPPEGERGYRPIAPGKIPEYFAGLPADAAFYGHDHAPAASFGETWLLNPGSVGCPGREQAVARAGIFSWGKENAWEQLAFRYDPSPCVEKLRELELPAAETVLKIFCGV